MLRGNNDGVECVTQLHDFHKTMRLEIERWRQQLATAEQGGFESIAQTIRQWIAEGGSLVSKY
jgi:hypothetical protein